MSEPGDANSRWAEMLAAWAIPERIEASAPEPPYFFDPQVFILAADQAVARSDDTPSDAVARETSTDGDRVDTGRSRVARYDGAPSR